MNKETIRTIASVLNVLLGSISVGLLVWRIIEGNL